jgi:hypothetical protein
MQHTTLVRVHDRGGQLLDTERGLSWGNMRHAVNVLSERDARIVGTDDVRHETVNAGFVNGDDIRMLEPGCRSGFELKAFQQRGCRQNLETWDLDGNFTESSRVLGPVDNPKTSNAKLA